MRTAIPLTVLATALACPLATAPAHARARVFVASYGNDANPCTFGSPCKTFQQAVNVVDAGGEVTAIDSAGFGPINITKAVTITSPPGVEAGIVPTSGGDAITINTTAAADITLRGLTLEGAGIGATGINIISVLPATLAGGTINILGCVVKDFTGNGILVSPNSGVGAVPFMTIVIADSLLTGNGEDGIQVFPFINVSTSIYRTIVDSNGTGIYINSSIAGVIDSHVDNNKSAAIFVINNGVVALKRTTASHSNNGSNTDVYNDSGFLYLYDRNTIDNLFNGDHGTTDGSNNIGNFSGNALTKQATQ